MASCFDKISDARVNGLCGALLAAFCLAATGGAAEPTLRPEYGPIMQNTISSGNKRLAEYIEIATRRIDRFAEVQGLFYAAENQVVAFSIRKATEETGRVIVIVVRDRNASPEIVMREFDISSELCREIAALWFEELKKTGYSGHPKSQWRDDVVFHLAGYVNDELYSGYFDGADAEGNRLGRIAELCAEVVRTCELPKVDAAIEAKWKAALRAGK